MSDSIGDRMKGYEHSFNHHLPMRMPVIIRLDGKSFHTYTKGCDRPFDKKLHDVMDEVSQYLCKNISGSQVAYVQSDEISIFVKNYMGLDTQPWFDNGLQKMVSVSAGMASAVFTSLSHKIFGSSKLALFDSRAFVLPKEEVNNYFLWRQQDCSRNSVQMLARSLYSHKECNNKNNSELQEMCFAKGMNWNDLATSYKRGRCIIRKKAEKEVCNRHTNEVIKVVRSYWVIDNEIPIFSKDPDYINQYV